jgi:hypothetical protein
MTLEAIGDSFNLRWALSVLAVGHAHVGDLPEAENTARRMVAVARQQDNPYRLAAAFGVLAGILRLRGDLVDAERLHAESELLMSGLDDLHFGIQWLAEWAVVVAGLGDIERSRHLAAVARDKATQRADGTAMGEALWAEGEVLLAAGEPAVESFTKALSAMRAHSMPLRRVEALTGLAVAVDDAETAATATAAAITVRDEQHMVLPTAVAARLDEASQRWASTVGTTNWTQQLDELSKRPHAQLLDLLLDERPPPTS